MNLRLDADLEYVRTAFQIEIASSGERFTVPEDRTVLSVLADHDIRVPWSCGVGVCGTCRTRVLEGTPDHWDLVLTSAEHARGDVFTPCCSRSKTAVLRLDL